MSDVLYPLGPTGTLSVRRISRTIKDEFEDGSTQSRRLWTANYFKRRFTVRHENLTRREFDLLASFFAARDGGYDSFWYRDNHNRGGNAKVRLVGDFPIDRGGAPVYSPELVLEEVAPIRQLPSYAEVATAAGANVLNGGRFHLWLDANREIEFTNTGDSFQGLLHTDAFLKNFARDDGTYTAQDLATEFVEGNTSRFNTTTTQWQDFKLGNSVYYRTAANFESPPSSQPALTIFCISKFDTSSQQRVLFGAGTMGAGKCFGLQLDASNYYKPWLGGSEVWSTARYLNSPAATFRSVAVTWAAGSNTAKLYVNGALIGSEANTRSYVDGRLAFGAAPDGTLGVNTGAGDANGTNHVMQWYFECSLAQIQALHNLFAHQYGLTTV